MTIEGCISGNCKEMYPSIGDGIPPVIEMCQECWDARPHRQSFDICSKCMTQCDQFDWSEWQ